MKENKRIVIAILLMIIMLIASVSLGEQVQNIIENEVNLEIDIPEGYCGYQKYNNQNILEYMIVKFDYEGLVMEITIAQSDMYRDIAQLKDLNESEMNILTSLFESPANSIISTNNEILEVPFLVPKKNNH